MNALKVTLKQSVIGRSEKQLEAVKGLGLRRVGQSRTLQNTPAIRGLVKKVIHLVEVEEVNAEKA